MRAHGGKAEVRMSVAKHKCVDMQPMRASAARTPVINELTVTCPKHAGCALHRRVRMFIERIALDVNILLSAYSIGEYWLFVYV